MQVPVAPQPTDDLPSRLLWPVSPAEFNERYWGRQYLFIERNSAHFYDDVLRIEDIDLLLQSDVLPTNFVNVVSNGTAHPLEEWSRVEKAARGETRIVIPEKLLALHCAGATLILNQIHRSVPRLNRACLILAQDLGFPVRANVYVTPTGAQGFNRHSDDHEIFILQISGEKTFLVYGDTGNQEIRLKAGDFLYLPAGVFHEAHTAQSPSIHASVGLYPVRAYELIEELAALARQSPAFQRLIPATPLGVLDHNSELLHDLTSLFASHGVSGLQERLRRPYLHAQSRLVPGQFSNIFNLDTVDMDTIISKRPEVSVAMSVHGSELKLENGTRSLNVASFLRNSISQVLSGTPTTVRSIEGLLTDAGKISLVKSLIGIGVITIITPADVSAK